MPDEVDEHLLQAYLDDALVPAAVQRLDDRLDSEPRLLAAFDAMKAERATRVAAFNEGAPTAEEAGQFADAVLSSLYGREKKRRFFTNVRIASAVAACLVVGFAVGWIGRGRGGHSSNPDSSPIALQNNSPAHVHKNVQSAIHKPVTAEQGQYQVAVLDADGNIIALQRFMKLEDARQFADDLGQFELRRQQVQDSQPVVVSDQF